MQLAQLIPLDIIHRMGTQYFPYHANSTTARKVQGVALTALAGASYMALFMGASVYLLYETRCAMQESGPSPDALFDFTICSTFCGGVMGAAFGLEESLSRAFPSQTPTMLSTLVAGQNCSSMSVLIA